MKTLAILMLFLLFNNIVYTQDMTCNPPAISVGGVCTRQSLAFTNIYEDFSRWAKSFARTRTLIIRNQSA